MDMYRAFLAILISFVILLGYQYFFIGPAQEQVTPEQTSEQAQPEQQPPQAQITAPPPQVQTQPAAPQPAPAAVQRPAQEVKIDTELYLSLIHI